ncbi:Pentatricopeptide repeat (PPR) superfamily protein [Euphorbia peplus]|nr:Pentatricopeptide repeat (PPR) superfamily protein [Euphorbia peplus]
MALNILSSFPSRLPNLPHLPKPLDFSPKSSNLALFSFLLADSSSITVSTPKSSLNDEADTRFTVFSDEVLLSRVSNAKDADQVLEIIAEMMNVNGGVVSVSDCCKIISAALDRNNPELALDVFYAMRSSFDQGVSENGGVVERWKWSRPNVSVYTILVEGLASSLKVSDALKMIDYISRVGVSPGDEEVPFGKVVRCPTCMVAVAVAQPQHGVQIASCSKCRYQYELVSGDIISINSEEISKDLPAWERGLRFLQIMKRSIPVAVHSIVVQTPSGTARTHRFATETVDLPAQEGERVTIASAPSNVYRNIGPFKFSPKAPNTYPGEAMCITNHENGRESLLLRAPTKDERLSLLNPSVLIPLLAVLATGDAASGIIDPSLPQFISVAAIASVGFGATLNTFVFPQLNQLPQRSADAIGIKQQLLSQYDVLQSRIKDLKQAAEKEVWMLARMCQLENKIFAVGEPSYRARRTRVKRVREGLESSLRGRIELIDSYARISSMIEIEVEMDSDVLAAEAASNAENIAEQIEQIMELENLEEKWRIQAEANDEAERLLSSQPIPTEQK